MLLLNTGKLRPSQQLMHDCGEITFLQHRLHMLICAAEGRTCSLQCWQPLEHCSLCYGHEALGINHALQRGAQGLHRAMDLPAVRQVQSHKQGLVVRLLMSRARVQDIQEERDARR